MQAGNINDHHISDLLPAEKNDQTPEAKLAVQHDGRVIMAQDAVEDHQPDIAQNDTTDEVRHEEDRPENIRALDAARQRIGNREGQHVDDQQRHDRKERREPECM